MKIEKELIILTLIFLILLPFFYLHQGLFLIDTGREFYIPQQILHGGILFKDIFNIYGALSYQFNALLFLIFGQYINVLASFAAFNSFIILISIYFLAREFFSKSISFLFSLLICFALVFKTFLFNSNMPYAFAIIYALSSFILSLLFLIKFTKNNKNLYAYFACFFAGVSIANKYEFFLYLFVLFYFLKNIGIKNFIKAVLCFCLTPALSFLVLFIQSLNLNDIKISLELIRNLVFSPLIKDFFARTSFAVLHNGILGFFAFLPLFNILFFLYKRKEIINNKALLVLVLAGISSSLKSFFILNVNHMGIFLFPVCILTFLTMLNLEYKKIIPFFLTACILIFAADDINSLQKKDYFLMTEKGNIFTFKKEGKIIEDAAGFIFQNTKNTDRVVILPEGCIINFITGRKGDNTYYNLSPLFYYDVFGERKIVKDFKNNLPEYFIILPIDNREYGYSIFGKDYAQNFYKIIQQNYNLVEEKPNMKIYQKN